MKTVCIVYSRANRHGNALAKTLRNSTNKNELTIKIVETGTERRSNAIKIYDDIQESDFVLTIYDQKNPECLVEAGYAIGINADVVVALMPNSRPPSILNKLRAIFLTDDVNENAKIISKRVEMHFKENTLPTDHSIEMIYNKPLPRKSESYLKKYTFQSIVNCLNPDIFAIDKESFRKYGVDFLIHSTGTKENIACVVKKSTKNYPICTEDVWKLLHVARDSNASTVILLTFMHFTEDALSFIRNNSSIILYDIAKLAGDCATCAPGCVDKLSVQQNKIPEKRYKSCQLGELSEMKTDHCGEDFLHTLLNAVRKKVAKS